MAVVVLAVVAVVLPSSASAAFTPLTSSTGCLRTYNDDWPTACATGNENWGAYDIALTGDDATLVATDGGRVSSYRIAGDTRPVDASCWGDPPCTFDPGLSYSRGLAASPDGRFAYAADEDWGLIRIYSIDPATSVLTPLAGRAGCVAASIAACMPGRGLEDGVRSITVTDNLVIVASYYGESVAVLARDPLTGTLSQSAGISSCLLPDISFWTVWGCLHDPLMDWRDAVATVTPDERFVYSASESGISAWQVDTTTAALTPIPGGCIWNPTVGRVDDPGCTSARTVDYPASIEVSPDSRFLIVGGNYGAIETYEIDPVTGALTQRPEADSCVTSTAFAACGSSPDWDLIDQLEIAPDGATLYAMSDYQLNVFDRDATSGRLTRRPGRAACFSFDGWSTSDCVGVGYDNGIQDIELTSDGDTMYAALGWQQLIMLADATASCDDVSASGRADIDINVLVDCQSLAPASRTFTVITPPTNGAITATSDPDGMITYRSNPAFAGTDFFQVRATDGVADVTFDVTVAVRAPAPPVETAPPTLAGPEVTGATLVANPGSWTGLLPFTWYHSWKSCDAAGGNCMGVYSPTPSSFVVRGSDAGRRISYTVTARNADGTTTSATVLSGVIADGAPVIDLTRWTRSIRYAPISGYLEYANAESPNATLTTTFEVCTPDLATCTAQVVGAATYRPTDADVGRVLRPVVTAANAFGTATATGTASLPVEHHQAESTDTPTLSTMTPLIGDTITVSVGAWTSALPVTHAIEWFWCDALLDECFAHPSATGPSYTVDASDVGRRLLVSVTGDNGVTSWDWATDRRSLPTEQVRNAADVGLQPPVNATAPTIVGTVAEARAVSVSTGAWSGHGPMTFTYAWRACTPACGGAVLGAAASFTPDGSLIGATLEATVTATNADGAATAAVTTTATVVESPPRLPGTVSTAGYAMEGNTLSSYPSVPFQSTSAITSVERAWRLCDMSSACTVQPGNPDGTFTLTAGHLDWTIAPRMRAQNAAGWSTWFVGNTMVVRARPASSTSPPVISGSPAIGQTLATTNGAWNSWKPITFAYAWQRCGNTCTAIPGATGTTYVVVAADAGWRLRSRVSAFNGEYPVNSATSNELVVPASPTAPPVVTGTGRVGSTLTAMSGSWDGGTQVPASHAISWQQCAADGSACVTIAGATASTFVVRAIDYGMSLRVIDTATVNGVPAGSQTSAHLQVTIPAAPTISNVQLPFSIVEGVPVQVTWDQAGVAPITVSDITWTRCTAPSTSCATIASGSSDWYVPTALDIGKRLMATVTIANAGGSIQLSSYLAYATDAAAPTNDVAPTISGTAGTGQVLAVDPGTWSSTTPVLGYVYTWQRCDAAGTNCQALATTTVAARTLVDDDIGSTIRVVVDASNADSNGYALTAPTAVVTGIAPTISGTWSVELTGWYASATATASTITGSLPRTISYQWEACTVDLASCTPIGGTDSSLWLLPNHVGRRFRVTIVVSNASGSASTSAVSGVMPWPAPVVHGGVKLVGEAITYRSVGLTSTSYWWQPVDGATHFKRWERCDATATTCSTITTGDSSGYWTTAADSGAYVRVVWVFQGAGQTYEYPSNLIGPFVDPPPIALDRPSSVRTSTSGLRSTWNRLLVQWRGVRDQDSIVQSSRAPASGPFGAWTTVATTRSDYHYLSLGAPGSTTCARVVNVDGASDSQPSCATRPIDDRSLSRTRGWSRRADTSAYLRGVSTTRTRFAQLRTPPVIADRIVVHGVRCSWCGRIQIRWNGRLVKTVSLRASQWNSVPVATVALPRRQRGVVTIRTLDRGEVTIDGIEPGRITAPHG